MKKENRQRSLVIGLVIVLILVIFACLNINPVEINFGFFKPQLPLIIVLVIMMLLGAIASFLLGHGEKVPNAKEWAKQKQQITKNYEKTIAEKNQKISELEDEIDRLNNSKNQESSTDNQD